MALFKTESRIQIVGCFFLLGLSAIIGKLWYLQVLRNDFYVQKIRGSGDVTVRIPSVRGEIRDKNGFPLVRNRPSFDVDFMLDDMVKGYKQAFGARNVPKIKRVYTVKGVYQETNEPDVAKIVRDTVLPRFQQLGFKEDLTDKQLQKHYRTDTLVPFTYLEDIDYDEMAKLTEHDLGLPGVDVSSLRAVREYPYGALAAHILGYVGAENDVDEEEAKNYNYYQGDVDGKTNIELTMNKWLSGKPGKRIVTKNAKGVIEGDKSTVPPVTGDDVYLTIDARIQTIAENAMRVVGRGAAVVVDPSSGDILAMASVPSFDPNTFIPSISKEDFAKLNQDDTNPLTNRATLSYAPGSTFKTVTGFAGLLMGKGNNKYTCSGGVTYGGRYMHCWIGQKGGSHGTLDLEGGIKNSCNAYFFQYGNAAGVDAVDKVATLLGFGQKTGLPLSNESPGILPGKEWFGVHYPREHWSDAHTANLSIGQGFVQASPVQIAMLGATIANGGTCYYPRLIDRVVDRQGQDVVDPDTGKLVAAGPRVRSNLVTDLGLTPEQIEHIRHGMWRVVNDPGGTAPKAKLKNIEVAGKTGTAQFWRKGVSDNHTWFMSFAPYKDPKLAVVVFIQGAKGGGVTAAPIAARIIEETLALETGKSDIQVKSLEPAKGSFAFINAVDFKEGVASVQTAANSDAATAGRLTTTTIADANDETPLAENEMDHPADANERNADHDRVADAPTPKVSEKSSKSERSSSRQVASSEGTTDTPMMKSMRKFFRRDNTGGGDDDRDTQSQQKTLRKQQKALQKQQAVAANQPPPAATPAPKRKKFLGLF